MTISEFSIMLCVKKWQNSDKLCYNKYLIASELYNEDDRNEDAVNLVVESLIERTGSTDETFHIEYTSVLPVGADYLRLYAR